jgi:hypothetical protein
MSIYLVAWFLSVEKGRRAVISAPGSRCELQKVQAASRSLPSRYTTSRLPPCCISMTIVKQVPYPASHYSKSRSITVKTKTNNIGTEHQCCVSGIMFFLTPGSGIRAGDSGWKKIQSQDPRSGMNIPDLLFENFVNFLD